MNSISNGPNHLSFLMIFSVARVISGLRITIPLKVLPLWVRPRKLIFAGTSASGAGRAVRLFVQKGFRRCCQVAYRMRLHQISERGMCLPPDRQRHLEFGAYQLR